MIRHVHVECQQLSSTWKDRFWQGHSHIVQRMWWLWYCYMYNTTDNQLQLEFFQLSCCVRRMCFKNICHNEYVKMLWHLHISKDTPIIIQQFRFHVRNAVSSRKIYLASPHRALAIGDGNYGYKTQHYQRTYIWAPIIVT